MPGAELYYFPGGGNSVTFLSPGGIDCIAGRLTYSALCGMFSMVWDEATTVDLPEKLADAVAHTSNWSWPHTFIVPKYATMGEYKQYAPANHFHAAWDLKPEPPAILDGPIERAFRHTVVQAAAVARRRRPAPAAAVPAQRRRKQRQDAEGAGAISPVKKHRNPGQPGRGSKRS